MCVCVCVSRPDEWIDIAKQLDEHRDAYDGFLVVIHTHVRAHTHRRARTHRRAHTHWPASSGLVPVQVSQNI